MTRIDRIYRRVARADERWVSTLMRGWPLKDDAAAFWHAAWHRLLAREMGELPEYMPTRGQV